MRQYLFIDQLARLVPWTEGAIRKMIQRGQFKHGVHYFQRAPRGRIMFLWDAVEAYIKDSAGEASF